MFFLTSVFSVLWLDVDAQTLQFGLQCGYSSADAEISPLPQNVHTSGKKGIIAGGMIGLQFSPITELHFEGYYSRKGSELRYRESLVETALFEYLDLPITLVVHPPGNTLRPFAGVGTQLGILFNAMFISEFQDGYSIQYVTDRMKKLEWGIQITAGFNLMLSQHVNLMMSFRYAFGLTNLQPESDTYNWGVWKSRSIYARIVVLYSLDESE